MKNLNQTADNKVFFPNLDGLRTMAFLFVFVQHALWGSFQALDIQSEQLKHLIYSVVNGGNGVSIFFVLSGFLITYLLLTESNVKGRIHLLFFYIRRILRIWPLYYALLLFAFIIYPYLKSLMGIDSNLASRPMYYFTFLSNFDSIYIQKFHPGADAMMEGITWSVAVEEQFYLIWPLLFIIVPKRFYRFIFPFIIAICLLFRFINRHEPSVTYFHSLSVCADLAVGGYFAYQAFYSEKLKLFFENLSKRTIIGLYIVGLLWIMYSGVILNLDTEIILSRLINTIFFAFIILEQNFSKNSFYKFSQSKVLTFWGKYTYGLYLLHPIALLLLDVSLRIAHISYKETFLPSFIVGLVALFLSALMSYVSYEYYEKHFLKLKEKFSFIYRKEKSLSSYKVPAQSEVLTDQS